MYDFVNGSRGLLLLFPFGVGTGFDIRYIGIIGTTSDPEGQSN